MEQYDIDGNGQINFQQFLRMFRGDLLDLKEILDYIGMNPAASPSAEPKLINATFGEVTMIFSEQELDALLKEHHERLVCLEVRFIAC